MENYTRNLYITLLQKSILDDIYCQQRDVDWRGNIKEKVARNAIINGLYWPDRAHTMIGYKRMDNIKYCVETCINENIKGDFIETGVWRGGACIFMAGLLKAYQITNRKVYVCDSFKGLPPPDSKYPIDKEDDHYLCGAVLSVDLETVKNNFKNYDLLNEQIVFIEGFFETSLSQVESDQLAVLRLDGDMYSSTIQALDQLYDKVVDGGFIIIDDWALPGAKAAVIDFRNKKMITEEIINIDDTGAFWRKKNEKMIYLYCHPNCRCFIPFMENFEYILLKNKIKAKFVTELIPDNDDLWFVIWNDLEILPNRCISYNMDPMVPHIENAFKELLKRNPTSQILKIVDYSYGLNINILSEFNIPIFHMPYGYSSYHIYEKEQICGDEIKQFIDILFYGNISERRIPYINALKELSERKGYNFVIRNNDLYDEREKILTIAMSKIVVSIASNCTKIMKGNDLARSSQVISSEGFIITENIGDETVESKMSDYVPHFNIIEELIEKVDYYLTYPKERIKLMNIAKERFPLDFNLEKELLEILEI